MNATRKHTHTRALTRTSHALSLFHEHVTNNTPHAHTRTHRHIRSAGAQVPPAGVFASAAACASSSSAPSSIVSASSSSSTAPAPPAPAQLPWTSAALLVTVPVITLYIKQNCQAQEKGGVGGSESFSQPRLLLARSI